MGLPIVIDDVVMDCMDAYEANDLVDMMNLKDFRVRGHFGRDPEASHFGQICAHGPTETITGVSKERHTGHLTRH